MQRDVKFIGQASAFLDAVERVSLAAPLQRPVLVIGERGTGKELIAERLHRLGTRWDGPLVTMNCAALPETLIEAELFGHEAGAFTGATKSRVGRFEEADGGTLFLDELGTLSMGAQERLLRAVEYGEITRIGSSKPTRVDVRIIGATNENLPKMAAEGKFRLDLLDRLSFEVITLPPLRAREGDIEVLAEHFGRRMASELGWSNWPGFGDLAKNALDTYQWPGNVRELRNVVERAVYRWADETQPVDYIIFDPFDSPWIQKLGAATITPKAAEPAEQKHSTDLSQFMQQPAQNIHLIIDKVTDLRQATEDYEKAVLEQALAKSRYNQKQTAKALNLSYDQLRHCLKKYDLLN
ncbi:phage shock protein operon transcriptional activator [Sphingorhabdus lutea]|uniref:Phage shock protein operon transcriptional activator n=1 Tax=Sphingorhabdus lutea TaxID=1913578 RepID=A0A1L3JC45_9SPHN|nr:phage shock protein operon transcriptional activator [Sphingorhabdus lutea]APG62669.1 phage shock protein operon transcriptional activator [Sphingorhabdus lutea]